MSENMAIRMIQSSKFLGLLEAHVRFQLDFWKQEVFIKEQKIKSQIKTAVRNQNIV